jgi:hypothetical protein
LHPPVLLSSLPVQLELLVLLVRLDHWLPVQLDQPVQSVPLPKMNHRRHPIK